MFTDSSTKSQIMALLSIYEEEISLLLWTAGLLFIIRSSGIVLNNYAETAFLKRFGVEYIPVVNMLNAVSTFLVTGIITALLSRIWNLPEPRPHHRSFPASAIAHVPSRDDHQTVFDAGHCRPWM